MEEKNKNKKIIIIAFTILVIIIVILIAILLSKEENVGNNTASSKISDSVSKDDNVKIKKSEAASLQMEEYKTDDFTMKKPTGWKVETGGSGIYYAIKVTDPNDDRNQAFLMLKMQPFLKSETAKQYWNNYYNLSGYNSQYKLFSEAVVLDEPTTEGFYKKFNDIAKFVKTYGAMSNFNFPTLNNFTKVEESQSSASMKSVALDSKVLRATFKDANGKDGEGMFMASIVNFGTQYTGNIDLAYYMVYDIVSITSVKDEFINYQDILTQTINSIDFSSSFVNKTIDDGNTQTKNALALSASVQSAFDSYMNAWENRQKSYDIMSQKQSDATLGYERVYNTDTGEIYKVYNGFTDDYDGNKYKAITDNMYTEKTSGYIEK